MMVRKQNYPNLIIYGDFLQFTQIMYFSKGVANDPIKGCTDALVSLVDQE